MLIYLYGANAYERQKKLAHIVDSYTKKHSATTREIFFMEEKDSLERLTSFLQNQSLFGNAQLAIVYNPQEADHVAKFLKGFLEHKTVTILVVSEKKLPKEFSFLLKKPTLVQSFDIPEGPALRAFIQKEATARGVVLTPDILHALGTTSTPDTWHIVTELEKIALGGTVQESIESPAFFPLIQAFKKEGVASRLRALAHLLRTGDPAAIFNITASIADSTLKIKMANYDIAIKSGKLEYTEALTDIALDG